MKETKRKSKPIALERKDKLVYGDPTNMNVRKTKYWIFYLVMH